MVRRFVRGLVNHITISAAPKDEETARKLFGHLKEGGKVEMELSETGWQINVLRGH